MERLSEEDKKKLEENFLKNKEQGYYFLTIKQAKEFAKRAYVPFGYLIIEKLPINKEIEEIPYFRKHPNEKLPIEVKELIKDIKEKQDFLNEYLQELGNEKLEYVGIAKGLSDPKEIAYLVRRYLELPENWTVDEIKSRTDAFKYLRYKAEKAGIFVFLDSVLFGNNNKKLIGFKGFSLIDDFAPIVFINTNEAKSIQLFTLAHEIAHIFLGESEITDFDIFNISLERLANKVAVELLVPEKIFKEYFSKDFQQLSKVFKVSEMVLLIRALELKLIKEDEYRSLIEDYKARLKELEKEEKKEKYGDYYKTQRNKISNRFITLLIDAMNNNFISFMDASRLTRMKFKTLENFLKKMAKGWESEIHYRYK
ncbi:ImmA/IrrE family metallo-endopeptidase [Persephonella sp.]